MTSPSEFLSEFSDVPDLDGAACKGEHELFDATVYQGPHKAGEVRIDISYARKKAMQICATCPAIKSCSEWVDSIPAYRRPAGVVAGQVKFRSNKNGKPLLPGEGGPPLAKNVSVPIGIIKFQPDRDNGPKIKRLG